MIGFDSEWDNTTGYYLGVLSYDAGTYAVAHDREAMRALLHSLPPATPVSSHSAVSDYGELGYYPNLFVHDSYVLSTLLDETGKHGLKELAPRCLNRVLNDPITVPKDGKNAGRTLFFGTPIDEADQAEVLRYCLEDCRASADLTEYLLPRLDQGSSKWYYSVEQPLIGALVRMRLRGIAVDEWQLTQEECRVAEELPALEKAVYAAAGYEFNANSTLELGNVLYTTTWTRERDHKGVVGYCQTCEHGKKLDKCKVEGCVGLKPKYGWRSQEYPGQGLRCPKLSETGRPSTDEEALLANAGNAVVKALLDYREVLKIQQFLESWRKYLKNGRLYPRLDQVGTVTGRFTCRDPNLQQVPRRGEHGKRMRRLFVARPGHKLVVCDQDSIEARLLCSFARETKEIERFKAGVDVHQALADELSEALGMDITRDAAKTVRYALLYGAGPRRIAGTLTRYGFPCTYGQARVIVKAFYTVLPGVQEWQKKVERAATKTGTVQTIGGRTRHLTGTWSTSPEERARALRQAGNSVVQGSAADLTKRWIVTLDYQKLPLVLTVHDEVLMEMPVQEMLPPDPPAVPSIYLSLMENTLLEAGQELGIKVPTTGTAHAVDNWGEK